MPVEWVFHRGETTHTLAVESWSYVRSRTSGTRWSLVLSKPDYWPAGSIGQYFEPFERDGSDLQSWISATFSRPGRTDHESSQLVILDVNWDEQPDGLKCEIGGTDVFSERLLDEGVALGDRRSSSSTVYNSAGIIAEVAEACGISSGAIETGEMTSTTVPVFHAVGQGQGLIRNLLELCQGWWKADGGSLRFYDGGIDPDTVGASFLLNESNCKAAQYRKSSTAIYNRATYERVSETKYAFGPEMLYGYGAQEISLNFPVNEGHLRINPYGQGLPENPVWDDAGGTPLTPSPVFSYRGSTPAAKVRFTLTPSLEWGANPMAYEATVTGHNNVDEVDPFEEAYSATYNDTADQAIRGVIPYPDPQVSELCADQAAAELGAEKLIKEQLLNYCSLTTEGTMDPEHDIGLIAEATFPKLALSSKPFLVQTVSWTGDENQELESLEMSRGAA